MTRNDRTALALVGAASRKRLASFSNWQGDFRQTDADQYDALTRELTWVYGAQAGRQILNLSKKEVRPGLWQLYFTVRENGIYTLYKYSGTFTSDALQVFAHGWCLKYSG